MQEIPPNNGKEMTGLGLVDDFRSVPLNESDLPEPMSKSATINDLRN